MKAFVLSALPFVIIGICLAILFTIRAKRKEQEDGDSENGMLYGMCIGLSLATAVGFDMGLGISLGMLIGMTAGMVFKP